MSFGESVFLAGFNQKTAKEDLFIKGNHGNPQRDQRGKTLEDSRRLSTKAGLHLPASQPMGPSYQPLFAMSVLHRLRVCIYAILLNRFDLRV